MAARSSRLAAEEDPDDGWVVRGATARSAADGAALEKLAGGLATAGVPHRVWVELPEGVPTAVAPAPGRKSVLQPHFKAGKLCRAGIGGK